MANDEYITPVDIVERARAALGGCISFDPASSKKAQTIVKAESYMTIEDNSLLYNWRKRSEGGAWMNSPFSRGNIKPFIFKACREFNTALVLTSTDTSQSWAQELLHFAGQACFVDGRLEFIDPELMLPVKGNSLGTIIWQIAQRGPNDMSFNVDGRVRMFEDHFGAIGKIVQL